MKSEMADAQSLSPPGPKNSQRLEGGLSRSECTNLGQNAALLRMIMGPVDMVLGRWTLLRRRPSDHQPTLRQR
jgi:hypothetical protein